MMTAADIEAFARTIDVNLIEAQVSGYAWTRMGNAFSLRLDSRTIQVEVTIGMQQPEKVDAERVKASLPHGEVTVKVVKGGLDVPDEASRDVAVIASAAVAVRMELPQAKAG